MRINEPVTQREYALPDNTVLMSTTDTQSRIQYANAAFIEASGFEMDELASQPHNLVRHPDMPAQAFADMWATLRQGYAWSALVKNRRKDGDHYWVRANATPLRRNGQHVGYLSVRTKPSREEVAAAEQLYSQFRQGKAGRRKFHRGLVVGTGLRALGSLNKTLPLAWRFRLAALVTGLAGFGAQTALSGGLSATTGALWLVAMGMLATVVERQFVRPVQDILRTAQEVAQGQMSSQASLSRCDELGMLMLAVTQSGLNLRCLVDDVSSQTRSLHSASGEIAAASEELRSRTEQAASSLQQTAAAMEELTSTIRSNADASQQATVLTQQAAAAAQQGGDAVRNAVEAMHQIAQASATVLKEVQIIDEIAFQTNILSLNAAVEAARAGAQGKGFAVVADEVRALARKCADAAARIKTLIQSSTATTQKGSTLVQSAGSAVKDSVGQVEMASAMVNQIGLATSEQAEGVHQVSAAVSHLDEVTQHNAAMVEQSDAAAQELKVRASRLSAAVAVYA